jgi:hypothetical protein
MYRNINDSSVSANTPGQDDQGYIPLGGQWDDQGGNNQRPVVGWRARTITRLSNVQHAVLRLTQSAYRRLRLSESVREILRECCSLPPRIRMIRESNLRVHFGRLAGNRLYRHDNARTLSCIRDTQDISKYRPKATFLDRQLFVQAWQLGAEWGLSENGIRCLGNLRNGQPASVNPILDAGGNSMPPLAVQQSTKRDPSNLLPSRERRAEKHRAESQ